nr:hypothetical protein [uncultured Bacteroides sp.]
MKENEVCMIKSLNESEQTTVMGGVAWAPEKGKEKTLLEELLDVKWW